MKWRVVLACAGFAVLGLALGRCVDTQSDKPRENLTRPAKENAVIQSDQPARRYTDATEIPGAIVIRPKLNPDMVYDPETKRTTDRRTGEYFAMRQANAIHGTYDASIRDVSGKALFVFRVRYNDPRNQDGSIKKVVYEIIWSVRGEDDRRLHEIGGHTVAKQRSLNDSLERLALFMRARRDGIPNRNGGGETVLVDRRMHDVSRDFMK